MTASQCFGFLGAGKVGKLSQETEFAGDQVGADYRGSNQTVMRARNERLVLTLIRRHMAISKAEIARQTGLSAQTVSVIIRALEQDGLLGRGAKVRGKIGQPSVPMRLAPDGAFFYGLKVGRRSAELVLVDFLGQIRQRVRTTYPYPVPQRTLDFARSALKQISADLSPATRSRIAGFGIATPFFLWEWASTIGASGEELAAWKGFDLREEVERITDLPVFLGNDATSACGAELVFGTAEIPRDFLYFYVGYFIGGGVVLNGKLYTGPSGNAGALGPLPMPGSSQDQLVDYASLDGLERRLVAAGCKPGALWESAEEWRFDTEVVDAWLAEAAKAIAHAILCAISVIDFATIVIDGSLPTPVRTDLVNRVQSSIDAMNLSGLIRPIIIAGSLGPDARPLGAASLPLANRFLLEG